MWEDFELASRAVRAGQTRSPENEHSEALYMTSSYVFHNAAEAAARFAGTEKGNIYSRFTNPTVAIFEKRLAAMEAGEQAVATASGMATILAVCIGHLEAGDHVLASRSIFGTTVVLFEKFLSRMGISTDFVALDDTNAWEQGIQKNTKLLFLESPSNPLCQIADIQKVADIAHQHDCLLVVDNCFSTPIFQQPLALGADIVVHSATKYIDGQGRTLGGAAVGSAVMMEPIYGVLRTTGPTLSAFNAWILLKGLETLPIRMQAHNANAQGLAEWLEAQNQVTKVHYLGLPSHPQFELAQKQQQGAGGLLSFEVKGGQAAAWQLIDQTRLISITANLGDTKTTITHPASTTHSRLSPAQREAAGISDGLIRISVGLEALADLQKDLAQGLS